LTKIEIKMLF